MTVQTVKTKETNILLNWMNKLLIALIKYKLNDIMKEKKNDLWNGWRNIMMIHPKIWTI